MGGVGDEPGLFEEHAPNGARVVLPAVDLSEEVVRDCDDIEMSLKAHPIGLLRKDLTRMGVRQRPARASVAVVADSVIERQGEVVHVTVSRVMDLSTRLATLRSRSRGFH